MRYLFYFCTYTQGDEKFSGWSHYQWTSGGDEEWKSTHSNVPAKSDPFIMLQCVASLVCVRMCVHHSSKMLHFEQWVKMEFWFKLGKTQNANDSLHRWCCNKKDVFQMIWQGNESLETEKKSGHPSTLQNDKNFKVLTLVWWKNCVCAGGKYLRGTNCVHVYC